MRCDRCLPIEIRCDLRTSSNAGAHARNVLLIKNLAAVPYFGVHIITLSGPYPSAIQPALTITSRSLRSVTSTQRVALRS